ncbi:ribonuclease domain-containing protein [Fodinibacter luteus]|uniref:Ribonuclease domain-containing protein n=1 Tax=Fodinibacter luteus TaxID=552064 RepID=A0ABP8K6K7_9MICO
MPSRSQRIAAGPATGGSPVRGWAVVVLVVATLVLMWTLARPEAERSTPAPPLATTAAVQPTVSPGPDRTPGSDLPRVAESALPAEARSTLVLIRQGGPFPHDEDDEVFGNREGLLPPQPRGYYREFTVETPGEDDRGPRRLVEGRGGDLYWTVDHYASFRQVEVGR